MTNKRETGSRYEEWAAAFLKEKGYQILCQNYYTRRGEIDLIAKHKGVLVFIEVKFRLSGGSGDPAEAVTPAKQRRIRNAAMQYMYQHRIAPDTPCRFDVVAILGSEVRLISDAF